MPTSNLTKWKPQSGNWQRLDINEKLRKGTPYISCLYEIENGKYDLVFACSHGRSDVKKALMGSTAEKVLRRSPISVFVTRR